MSDQDVKPKVDEKNKKEGEEKKPGEGEEGDDKNIMIKVVDMVYPCILLYIAGW